jgi:hypothetical protein
MAASCVELSQGLVLDLHRLKECCHIFDCHRGLLRSDVYQSLGLRPDYGTETSTVYSQIAAKILRASTSLNLLSVPVLPHGSGVGNLPSWVPDWSVAHDVTSLASYAVQNDDILNPFRSTGDTISPALLQVEGYTVEKLEALKRLLAESQIERHVSGTLVAISRGARAVENPNAVSQYEFWENAARMASRNCNKQHARPVRVLLVMRRRVYICSMRD